MKLKLDLLPQERKTVTRDIKGWVICAIFLAITFIWYIPYSGYLNKKINNVNSEYSKLSKEYKVQQSIFNNYSAVASRPVNLPSDVSFLIDFLSESSYSWYGFFDSIEKSAPNNLWIKEIRKNNINDFYLIGEAKDNYYISEFYQNLMKYENFDTIYLLQSVKEFNPKEGIEKYSFKIHLILKEENA